MIALKNKSLIDMTSLNHRRKSAQNKIDYIEDVNYIKNSNNSVEEKGRSPTIEQEDSIINYNNSSKVRSSVNNFPVSMGNIDYQKKIDRRTENDYNHQAYINSVKEASEKALKESQNLSLPKVYTQIPDLPLKRVDSEVISTIVEHSEEEIRGAIIDEQIWRSQLMNPAGAGFSFTRYSEGTPRNEIYPSSGDYWKRLNCKARGDRWYMLDHVCDGSISTTNDSIDYVNDGD